MVFQFARDFHLFQMRGAECNKMPAIPQGAFAACKIRAQREKQMSMAKMETAKEQQPDCRIFPNKKLMDLSPLKYNSKFMNAIWGHYNRYSPHNIKSTDADASVGHVSAQQ